MIRSISHIKSPKIITSFWKWQDNFLLSFLVTKFAFVYSYIFLSQVCYIKDILWSPLYFLVIHCKFPIFKPQGNVFVHIGSAADFRPFSWVIHTVIILCIPRPLNICFRERIFTVLLIRDNDSNVEIRVGVNKSLQLPI